MQFRSFAAVVLAAGLVVGGSADAATSKVKLACQADFQKLCATASASKRGAVMRCVKTRLDQVSPDCQSAVKSAQAKTAARKAAKAAKAA